MPKPAERGSSAQIAGIALSHPERVLYPEQGVTKRQLAEYFEEVADHILPHIADRPLSLVRCPRGQEAVCFFQRHLNGESIPGLERVAIAEPGGGSNDVVVVRNLGGLIGLAQLGVLEIHPWGVTATDPDHPDRLVFDLDPGEGATWPDVVHGARWLHERLAALGLQSFVRTTGGKGLHVVVPIAPTRDWDAVKAFARAVAHELAGEDPLRYVDAASKQVRVGRVFVDYLRNARGASAIASYSPRARPHAPVAAPLLWPELAQLVGSDVFTISNIPDRLAALRAPPWTGFFEMAQPLTDAMLAEVGAVNR